MNSKQWMKRLSFTTFIVIFLPVLALMWFNFWIDPLWNFNHKNDYNDFQVGFNERQQKTNLINSLDFNYDGLMIGTSRVTYMNEHDFTNEKVFNYSLSSLHINEYLPYIEYATKKNKKDFHTIYMELYVNSYDYNIKNTNPNPSIFFDKAEDPFYKITTLFSNSTLQYSINNYNYSKVNHYDGPRSYTRDNVAQTSFPNNAINSIWNSKNAYKVTKYEHFPYDPDYKKKLLAIKNKYPNTKFVIFTDPVPAPRLDAVLSDPQQRKGYEHWYNDMVDVFGNVYSFQGHTPITTDVNNYFDWFHYYPKVGDKMIQAMEQPDKHKNIVAIVNKQNLHEYFRKVEK